MKNISLRTLLVTLIVLSLAIPNMALAFPIPNS